MINWNYDPNNVASSFELIPEGLHRVRIDKIDDATPTKKTGEPMLTLTLGVSGYSSTLRWWVPFLQDHPNVTNARLKELNEGFGCPTGDGRGGIPYNQWLGKVGVVEVVHEPQEKYPDRMNANIKRILSFAEARDVQLSPWIEPGSPRTAAMPAAVQPGPGPAPVNNGNWGPMPTSYREQMPPAAFGAGQGVSV